MHVKWGIALVFFNRRRWVMASINDSGSGICARSRIFIWPCVEIEILPAPDPLLLGFRCDHYQPALFEQAPDLGRGFCKRHTFYNGPLLAEDILRGLQERRDGATDGLVRPMA